MEKFIQIKAFIASHIDDVVPFWDKRIEVEFDENVYEIVKLDGLTATEILAVWDVENRCVSNGVAVEVPIEKIPFEVGKSYLHDTDKHHVLRKAILLNINLSEQLIYATESGDTLDSWQLNLLKQQEIKFNKNMVYTFKYQEPVYHFDDGFSTKYESQIYSVEK